MRRISNADFEGNHALISLAGFRVVKQNSISAGPGAESTYTVQFANCRRVVILHLAVNDADIRYEYQATSDATKMPILPRRYFIVEAWMIRVEAKIDQAISQLRSRP